MYGEGSELRLTRVALQGHPSKKTIVHELTKRFKNFGKYLEPEKENYDHDNHVISKAMRFHSRPKKLSLSLNKKLLTEAEPERTHREKPGKHKLDIFCESNIKEVKCSKDLIKEKLGERRILTEMNPDSSMVRKTRARNKNFLLHNFNKTRQSQAPEEKPRLIQTMPMKNKQFKKSVPKEEMKDTFMLSPWNHSLLSQNKENIFY